MQPEGDEELWEVIVSPDDIKLLTLDQLDDMFRLEVISASTLVRQQGTSSWQRLGVVAGIEEERGGKLPADWDDVQPRPAPAFGVQPKLVAGRAPSFGPHPFWGAGAATEALPLLDVDAPILTAQAAEPALEPPSFDSLTRAEPMQARPAPFRAPARAYAPPRSSPLASGFLLFTALVAGLWALHRNDLLRSGANRLGLATKYLAFEQTSLGKPGFGTPRALEAFLIEIGDLPATTTAAASPSASPAQAPEAGIASSAPKTEKTTTPPPSSDGTKAVSLDALPVLPAKTDAPVSAPAQAPKAAPAAPRGEAPAPPRKAGAPSEKISLDEAPAKAPAKPQKPENPLQAAIRQAMEKQKKSK